MTPSKGEQFAPSKTGLLPRPVKRPLYPLVFVVGDGLDHRVYLVGRHCHDLIGVAPILRELDRLNRIVAPEFFAHRMFEGVRRQP